MIILSNDLIRKKSQIQRSPILTMVEAIDADVYKSPSLEDVLELIEGKHLSNTLCGNVTAGERMQRAIDAASKIHAKHEELKSKNIDDSNIKQTISGVEKVISVAAHSIEDNLRIISIELTNGKSGQLYSIIDKKRNILWGSLDDFDLLMKLYTRRADENYDEAVGKDLTYIRYMNALGREPATFEQFLEYLYNCTESALDDEDIKAAKQQGIDDSTLFDIVKNLVKPPIVFRVHGAMAAAAQESFEQNDALDKLIGETLPAFADEIFERDDKDGLFGAFCDIYDELTRK